MSEREIRDVDEFIADLGLAEAPRTSIFSNIERQIDNPSSEDIQAIRGLIARSKDKIKENLEARRQQAAENLTWPEDEA